MDKLDSVRRSENMRAIRSKNTAPELVVRRLVHSLGFRFRLHGGALPGKPDLVFPGRKKVIFVHGCFWHLHGRCREGRVPATRRDYWLPKLEGNKKRDARNRKQLREMGWEVLVLWECQIQRSTQLADTVHGFLSRTHRLPRKEV